MSIEKLEAQIKLIEINISKRVGNYFAAQNKIKSLKKEIQKLQEQDLKEKKQFEAEQIQLKIF